MTDTAPTLLTLCRRVEALNGPEVPSQKVTGSPPGREEVFYLSPKDHAALLRDHAAGPVVEWFKDVHGVGVGLAYSVRKWYWSVPTFIERHGSEPTREQALTAALAAALVIVEGVGDGH